MTTKTTGRLAFLLVSLLFMMWGIANNMNDTLIATFKRIMSMSDLQSSLVQFAFYGAYFCVSLPAALFISRYSYKAGIILGLILYAAGTMLFYPAGEAVSYGFFLFAIYVMAAGCAILETTANPYILWMGKPETATRRLNFAQTLNPLGAICGILISRHFILSELHSADATDRANMQADALFQIQHQELNAISGTYMIIGCVLIVLLVVIAFTKMPGNSSPDSRLNMSDNSVSADTSDNSEKKSLKMGNVICRLWRQKKYRYGVIAQFFYVGAQTCVWSFTIRLAMSELGILEKDASMIFLYSIIAFTLFRFFFTWLMAYIRPVKLLAFASTLAIVSTLLVVFTHGWTSIVALISISACMSLMFPTIYGVALNDVSVDDSKIAASGLIMAILGGALMTPLQAYCSDLMGISVSFIVSAFCFVVILIYAIFVSNCRLSHAS